MITLKSSFAAYSRLAAEIGFSARQVETAHRAAFMAGALAYQSAMKQAAKAEGGDGAAIANCILALDQELTDFRALMDKQCST